MPRAAGPSSVEAGKQCLGVFTRGLTGALTAVLSQSVQRVGGEGPPQLGRDSLGRPSLPMAHRSPVSGAGPQPLPPLRQPLSHCPEARPPGLACGASSQTGLWPTRTHMAPAQLLHTSLGKPSTSCLPAAFSPSSLCPCGLPSAHLPVTAPGTHPTPPTRGQCAQNALPSAPAIVPQPSLLPQMQRHHRRGLLLTKSRF